MARRKPKLDMSRPHGKCYSTTPTKRAFSQNGMWFDAQGEYLEDIEGAKKPTEAESEKVEAVERAEEILGDLDVNPNADAHKENAAARAAEENSEDA